MAIAIGAWRWVHLNPPSHLQQAIRAKLRRAETMGKTRREIMSLLAIRSSYREPFVFLRQVRVNVWIHTRPGRKSDQHPAVRSRLPGTRDKLHECSERARELPRRDHSKAKRHFNSKGNSPLDPLRRGVPTAEKSYPVLRVSLGDAACISTAATAGPRTTALS